MIINSYKDVDWYYEYAGRKVYVKLKNGETYRGRCKFISKDGILIWTEIW